jgi:alginate production protein
LNKKTLLSTRLSIGLGSAALLIGAPPAAAVDVDYQLKTNVTGEADGGRDLGLLDRGDSREAFLDATPWMHFQFSPQWSAFVRARLFAPTGAVLPNGNDNNNVNASSNAFVGLKEAWIDYGGLTSYPDESIRLGRQRIREDDAQFWDQDIDALRWIFNTTLLQAELGVGHQFGTYRSDDVKLPPDQKDRTYAFGTLSGEWRPLQRIGVRVVHADDNGDQPPLGQIVDDQTKLQNGHMTWAGVFADNHYYDGPDSPALAYTGSMTWLFGSQRTAITDPTNVIVGEDSGNLHAWAADVGLRYRLPIERLPLQFGASYAYSSGGDRADLSDQFSQTGLQSNYSTFTGTRALISRFTDAYRAELGNLRAATAFASLNLGDWDTSLIWSRYNRVHGDAPVTTDNILVEPNTNSRDLGNGYDLVVTRYFGGKAKDASYLIDDEHQSSLRLRGSVFDPGAAYSTASSEYRVTLELTLWY